MGLLPCSWRPLIVVLVIVVLVLVAVLMALIIAAVLMVLIGGISIVVSPILISKTQTNVWKCKLTTRHSNHRFHALDVGAHTFVIAHHAADIPDGHNSLGYARLGNMSLWLGVRGHNHHRSGLEDGPT